MSKKAYPSITEIKAARAAAALSPAEAAAVVYRTQRNWEQWEEVGTVNSRKMDPAIFELFLIKTRQLEFPPSAE